MTAAALRALGYPAILATAEYEYQAIRDRLAEDLNPKDPTEN